MKVAYSFYIFVLIVKYNCNNIFFYFSQGWFYFFSQGSSPECCADSSGTKSGNSAGTPVPPPGPRYKLASEGALRVCCFQHTRTVVDKILGAKFFRRWETHMLCLLEDHIVSKTVSSFINFFIWLISFRTYGLIALLLSFCTKIIIVQIYTYRLQ